MTDVFKNQTKVSRNISNASTFIIIFLIFFSVIPLASEKVWWEAVVFAVIYLLCGVNIWLKPQVNNDEKQLLLPIYILACYSFFQGLIAFILQFFISDYPSFLPQSFDLTASFWNSFKIFGFAIFFGLLLKMFQQKSAILTWGLLITGNFFALFGIFRYFFQTELPGLFERLLSPEMSNGVGFGTYFNQNHFAYLMLMVLGLNFGLFWYGSSLKKWRFLLLPAIFTVWTAIVLTASRGGIIGSFAVVVGLILFPLIFIKREKNTESKKILIARQITILAVVLVLLIVGVLLIGQDRIIGRFEEISEQIHGITDAETFRRADVWAATIEIIKNHPFFGIGFGGFYVAVSQYIDISGQLVPKQAHNEYLDLAASGGVLAVALAIWFLFRFFSTVKKRFTESSDSFTFALRVGAICGIFGVAVHSFFDFGLQIAANQLFFIALLFLAVNQSKLKPAETQKTGQKSLILKIIFSAFCFSAILIFLYFGLARFQYENIENNPNFEIYQNSLLKIPFDAEYYAAQSVFFERIGEKELALAELQNALKYRPKDFELWLQLGQIEQSLNQPIKADNAFRQAVRLAPFYAEPHLHYGKFLVAFNRQVEGFSELRIASRRNPKYFKEVVSIVLTEKNDKADELFIFLSPLNQFEKEQLLSLLLNKNDFQAIVNFVCREENFNEEQREDLIQKLLEKRAFRFSSQVFQRNCDKTTFAANKIEDGNFEKQNVKKGNGLGWRILSIKEYTRVSFDMENSAKGQSLRFDFNGHEPSFALLSQIITVETEKKYQISFFYKTNKIITGGVPVVQIVFLQPQSELVVKEIKLSLEEKDWTQTLIEFETDANTQAIEIRLTRNSCGESLCPIFGTLWLDDFSLQRKN